MRKAMKRNHSFQVIWFVRCAVFVGYTYFIEFSLADTGVLMERKASHNNWLWLTTYRLGAGSGWSRQVNTGRYVVCDIPSTLTNHTNSWLISDFIQSEGVDEVVTSLSFTTRQCPDTYPFCVQYFNLFALFMDNDIPGGIPVNLVMEGKLSFLSNVTASVTWNASVTPQDNKINVRFLLPKKGFYLAFQDIGACLSLREVNVTYKYCPLFKTNGVTYKRTISPALCDTKKRVNGQCLDNASGYLTSLLLIARCLANGEWETDNNIKCLCNPGYEMHLGNCRDCPSGTHKSSHGNQVCRYCASHSQPSLSRDKCKCEKGYYRAVSDPKNSSCTAPPGPPVDLKAAVKAQEIVILVWLPPIDNGGRNDVTYDIICSQCTRTFCHAPCNDVLFWPAKQKVPCTHVTITGVRSKVTYRITILAKNGVSAITGINYHGNASVMLTIPGYSNGDITGNEKKAAIAIGVSVACTFVFCLVIGFLIATYLIHKQRKRVFVCEDSGYQRQRSESHTTEVTELHSAQQDGLLSIVSEIRRDNISETSEVNETAVSEASRVKGIPHVKPYVVNTLCGQGESVLYIPNTESQEKTKGSCVSVRSWFPQDVQYGI